jgi:hypothetical protein
MAKNTHAPVTRKEYEDHFRSHHDLLDRLREHGVAEDQDEDEDEDEDDDEDEDEEGTAAKDKRRKATPPPRKRTRKSVAKGGRSGSSYGNPGWFGR